MKYEKGDLVETPFGPGKITYLHEPTGNCNVKLVKPMIISNGADQWDMTLLTSQLGTILKPGKRPVKKIEVVL